MARGTPMRVPAPGLHCRHAHQSYRRHRPRPDHRLAPEAWSGSGSPHGPRRPHHSRRRPDAGDLRRPRRRRPASTAEGGVSRRQHRVRAILGPDARSPPSEADAVLLDHADDVSRVHRREPRARQRGGAGEPPAFQLPGLRGDSHGRRARRGDHEQRQPALPLPVRARVHPRRAAARSRAGGGLRVVGDLQLDRGASGRRADDQRGVRAVRDGRSGGAAPQRCADRSANTVGHRASRRRDVPPRDGAPRGRTRSTSRSTRRTTGRTTAATIASCSRCTRSTATCGRCGPGSRPRTTTAVARRSWSPWITGADARQ